MQLKEIMIKKVITVAGDETVTDAARQMREAHIGCLVVTDTGGVKGIVTDPQNTIVCSQIGEVEVSSAFCRRCREGSITTTERDQLIATLHHDCSATYHAINVTDDVLTEAVHLLKAYPLRAYDAIQLATALVANQTLTQQGLPSLIFVCADGRLLQAAIAEGLAVEDPNNHP